MANTFWDANSTAGSGTFWNQDEISVTQTNILEANRNGRTYHHRQLFENANPMGDTYNFELSAYTAQTEPSEVDEPLTAVQMAEIADRFDREYRLVHESVIPPLAIPSIDISRPPNWKEMAFQWEQGMRWDAGKIVQIGGAYDAVFDELDKIQDDDTNKKVHDILKNLLKV